MEEKTDRETGRLCTKCHASVAVFVGVSLCPACGGKLIPLTAPNLDSVNAQPRPVDRRGILLPPRHAVGGVITPR